MKKLIFILLLAVGVSAQTVNYDKFKDETTVTASIGISKIGIRVLSTVNMNVMFTFPGQKIAQSPDELSLIFSYSVGRNGWMWLDNRNLIFLIDGERNEIGQGIRESRSNASRYSYFTEYLAFKVDRTMLDRIAKASKVEMQVGPFEGYMGEKDQKKLKELLDWKP